MGTKRYGKVYTTCFLRFDVVLEMVPDAKFYAVTRTPVWMRGAGSTADLRRSRIEWLKVVSPSKELRERVKKEKLSFNEFLKVYRDEMLQDTPQETINRLGRAVADGKTIVLHCFERRGESCHRYALAEMIEQAARDSGFGNGLQGKPNGGELIVDGTPLSPRQGQSARVETNSTNGHMAVTVQEKL